MSRAGLFGAIVAALVIGTGGYFYNAYSAKLGANDKWVNDLDVDQETRLNQSIFDIATEQKLILPVLGDSGELLLATPSCESLLIDAKVSEPPSLNGYLVRLDPDNPKQRNALELLCETRQGEELRNEILAANAGYRTLAIRDNRYYNPKCQSNQEGLSAEVFVPRGCKPNTWQVALKLNESAARASWITGAEPSSSEFSFLVDSAEPITYFGDWAMVKPDMSSRRSAPRYTISDSIEVDTTKTLTVELAGKLRLVRIFGRVNGKAAEAELGSLVVDPAKAVPGTAKFGPLWVELKRTCGEGFEIDPTVATDSDTDVEDEDEPSPAQVEQAAVQPPVETVECNAEPDADDERAVGYKILVNWKVRKENGKPMPVNLRFEIEAEPTPVLPEKLRRAYVAEAKLVLTRHIRAECRRLATNSPPDCALAWFRVPGVERKDSMEFDLALAKEPAVKLVDGKTGIISQRAFDLGLAPIVGLGPQQYGSLAYALSRPVPGKKTNPLQLTIDADLQSLVLKAVKVKAGANEDQTVTVVLIDAGARAGEI